ncbi:hypothetical protein ACH4VQ_25275 [Streptomyces anulatus]
MLDLAQAYDPMTAWSTRANGRGRTPMRFTNEDLGVLKLWAAALILAPSTDRPHTNTALRHAVEAAERAVIRPDTRLRAVFAAIEWGTQRSVIDNDPVAPVDLDTASQLADPGQRSVMATRARYAEVVQGNLRRAAQELSGRPADLVRTRMTLTNLDLDWDETTGEDETRDGAGREVANRAWDAALYEAVDRAIESFPLDRPDAHSPRASGAPSGAASPPATGDVPDRVGGHTRGADVRDNKEPTMNRPAEHAEVRPPDLDTVQRDVDHALSRRIELPPRSVIDAGTDALVQHLSRFMDYDYGHDEQESGGIAVRNLYRVAERNLDVPVRPAPQTSHRAPYVYWHTVATLTTAFRDLYLTHNGNADQEPPADGHHSATPDCASGRGPGARHVRAGEGLAMPPLRRAPDRRPLARHVHRRHRTPHRPHRTLGLRPPMPVATPPGPRRRTHWWLLVLQTALLVTGAGALLLGLWILAAPPRFRADELHPPPQRTRSALPTVGERQPAGLRSPRALLWLRDRLGSVRRIMQSDRGRLRMLRKFGGPVWTDRATVLACRA